MNEVCDMPCRVSYDESNHDLANERDGSGDDEYQMESSHMEDWYARDGQ